MMDMDGVFYDKPLDPEDMGFPAFDNALAYWRSLKGEAFAPAWRDVRLERLDPATIRNGVVVDVAEGGLDFKYRYFGGGVVGLLGYEMTGRLVSSLRTKEMCERCLGHFQQVVAARKPVAVVSQLKVPGRVLRHSFLRMPLSDDGQAVTHILGLNEFARDRQELMKAYGNPGTGLSI